MSLYSVVLALASLVVTAAVADPRAEAPAPASSPSESTIGYPTVAAALETLRARSDASVSVQGGWTVITAGAERSLWSFTPANHPAHPAVVKRTVVEQDGSVFIEMRALCQASKAACDKLLEEFKQLNDRMREDMQRRAKEQPRQPAQRTERAQQNVASSNADASWRPSPEQSQSLEGTTMSYFAARDSNKVEEAYALLALGQKQYLPFGTYRRLLEEFNAKAGAVQSRRLRATTCYKDAPQAGAGLYVAVDFSSGFANLALHCRYVVWQEQADGSFLQVREEVNVIDNETMAKLKPGDIEKFRAQFRC